MRDTGGKGKIYFFLRRLLSGFGSSVKAKAAISLLGNIWLGGRNFVGIQTRCRQLFDLVLINIKKIPEPMTTSQEIRVFYILLIETRHTRPSLAPSRT